MPFIVQTSDKQTEINFQMNANELYPIVKPEVIVGICGQTRLVTSFTEHAIGMSCDHELLILMFSQHNHVFYWCESAHNSIAHFFHFISAALNIEFVTTSSTLILVSPVLYSACDLISIVDITCSKTFIMLNVEDVRADHVHSVFACVGRGSQFHWSIYCSL